ncbi:MAG TPA: helix-hairpin-helix domain-containing protein [Anaerolineaceae bacterium]|nr:helix-hairpin-helix domain-containing protein [Anaerolineaceae bacterium]
MNTWKSLLLGIVLGLLISGAVLLIALPPRGQPLILSVPTASTSIVVYVTGAVKNPGIYTLARPSRVNDAVQAAGGFLETADTGSVNLAAKIEDGAKILVPAIQIADQSAPGIGTASPSHLSTPKVTPTVSFPIDINSADATLLDQLPGIGSTKAAAIVAYRQEHGPFKRIEDIQNVPGIGSGLFATMKDLITIDQMP